MSKGLFIYLFILPERKWVFFMHCFAFRHIFKRCVCVYGGAIADKARPHWKVNFSKRVSIRDALNSSWYRTLFSILIWHASSRHFHMNYVLYFCEKGTDFGRERKMFSNISWLCVSCNPLVAVFKHSYENRCFN